jgi:hypothetical protein
MIPALAMAKVASKATNCGEKESEKVENFCPEGEQTLSKP